MTQTQTTMTNTVPTPNLDGIKTRIVGALSEARKVRHHRDCHCRMFDRQFCNAADALWQRALNRLLDDLTEQENTQ